MIHILSVVAGHKIRSIKGERESVREREVDQSQKGQSNYGGVFLKVLIKKVATGKRADLNRVVADLSNVCPPST